MLTRRRLLTKRTSATQSRCEPRAVPPRREGDAGSAAPGWDAAVSSVAVSPPRQPATSRRRSGGPVRCRCCGAEPSTSACVPPQRQPCARRLDALDSRAGTTVAVPQALGARVTAGFRERPRGQPRCQVVPSGRDAPRAPAGKTLPAGRCGGARLPQTRRHASGSGTRNRVGGDGLRDVVAASLPRPGSPDPSRGALVRHPRARRARVRAGRTAGVDADRFFIGAPRA